MTLTDLWQRLSVTNFVSSFIGLLHIFMKVGGEGGSQTCFSILTSAGEQYRPRKKLRDKGLPWG